MNLLWINTKTYWLWVVIYFSDSHTYLYIWCPKICSHGNLLPVNLPLAEICHPEICPPRKKTHHRSSRSCMLGSKDIFIKWESQLATAILTKKWVFYPGQLCGEQISRWQISLGGKFPVTNFQVANFREP